MNLIKGGVFLSELHLIIAPKNLNHIKWKVVFDSPLLGINGATAVYGPKKELHHKTSYYLNKV